MDFIKTSSLRALIELTFQRNWNGLIWMSRKGVTTKRVKTVQTALSRISAQPRSPAGRGTNVHARPNLVRPSEVSAKVQTVRPTQSRPGKHCPRSATPRHDRARPAREPGERLAAAQLSRTTADAPSEPGNYVPRPAENFIGQFIRPTTAADHASVRPDRSDSPHDPMSGRSSRPTVQRRGRPEARFEAHLYFQARLNPKPPLKDLALYI
ncbi:unnamed protein product [Microthlaspi erraticum]|uniref:Uncharacterized protein n=1 Tax=Microthlaspi erraticum TaxID=1685480 RepID=A0A6D2KIA9_9BRAS|nr:unnamed protein product [Microthlaspi erraticum]